MRVVCFSSFTFSYLDRARVLFQSLRKWHPDWYLVALVTDVAPPSIEFDPASEPFDELVYSAELDIPNLPSWLFRHDIIEVCTAVKGPFLAQWVRRADIVVYLDPDIGLFGPLDCIELLKRGSADILLTPHQLSPDVNDAAVIDNEITSLATGIYNLGFVAISNREQGVKFADWWCDRLISFCHDDIPRGLFVDQRWCDHVPVFFENVFIIKDAGYNVASWNLSQRKVSVNRAGELMVNDKPLRFWHFTKLGPVGDSMTRRYTGKNHVVYEIWNWYRSQVEENKVNGLPARYWAYNHYDDGSRIERSHRLIYRQHKELHRRFPNPYTTSINEPFRNWVLLNGGR